jgi:hypothetical protein
MADDTIEVRIVATDELSPQFQQAAQNADSSFAQIRSGAEGVSSAVEVLAETTGLSTQKQADAWRGMIHEITAAEDVFIHDVLAGRLTLSQSLLDASTRLVQGEIENDAKYLTEKLIYDALGLNSAKLVEQGGLAVHLLTETAKTAATQAGVAGRSAAEEAGAAEGLGTQIAAAAKSVSIDAAQTFAGIFAFLSPLLGPAAAGPAAAGEAAVYGVAGSLSAFEVGAWEIPHDMAAIVHQGETIMPADFASGYRSAVGASSGTGTAAGSTPNFVFSPQVSALDARSVVALFNNPAIIRAVSRNIGAYQAANPSTRGAY